MIFATFRLLLILALRLLGRISFYFAKKRKKIAFDNVDLCFSRKSKIKKNKIVRDSYISLGHSLADFLLLRFYKKRNIDKYVEGKNFFYLEKVLEAGKGLILSTAHFGSWELAAHYLALKGYKSIILYNPIKKPIWLESYVKRNREINGNILLPKQASFLTIYRHLKNGGIVTFIADQHCSANDGIQVPLFNIDVWTHTSLIKLSLKTGAPIISGFMYTKNLFKYELELQNPLWPKNFLTTTDSEYHMAHESNKNLEAAIIKKPGHWMWQHRRFKNL